MRQHVVRREDWRLLGLRQASLGPVLVRARTSYSWQANVAWQANGPAERRRRQVQPEDVRFGCSQFELQSGSAWSSIAALGGMGGGLLRLRRGSGRGVRRWQGWRVAGTISRA